MYNVNAMVQLTDHCRQTLIRRLNSGSRIAEEYYKNLLEAKYFVYLGEIEQNSTRGVYASATGQVYSNIHVDNFERIPDHIAYDIASSMII